MSLSVKIRQMVVEDLESVVRIQENILQRPVASGWNNLVRLQLAKAEGISLVAVNNDQVIGFFFGDVKHGDFGLEHSGWIEVFGVTPKFMGEGVGRALAEAAFERFRELGVKEIYSAVRWDYGDLLAFFKNIGFSLSDFITLKARLD